MDLYSHFFSRQEKRTVPEFWTATSRRGMVCCAHYQAAAIGVGILAAGGNAVDAAVAVSMALGLVEPAASGPGGMAMVMFYNADAKQTRFFPGACRAPVAATPAAVAQSNRRLGYKAIAVPANIAVWDDLHRRYGSMPLQALLEPVSNLAQQGIALTPFQYWLLQYYAKSIRKGNAASLLFGAVDKPVSPGSVIQNPAYADFLQTLARNGFNDFYAGETAVEILADMRANDAFITPADFATITPPPPTEPLTTAFYDWQIYTSPPPGGGMTLLEMLNLFQSLAPVDFNPDSPEAALLLAAIIRRARQDRRKYRYIPVNYAEWEGPDLTSKTYAAETAAALRQPPHSGETTHFNVWDAAGNIVAVTQSIERSYGAKVATPSLGFLYNGFMKAFKIENRRHPYFLQPGRPARSNAAPTLVFQNGKPIYSIGSTGSERMSSGVFQVLVRLRAGQSPFEAVAAPRLHCNPEGQVFLEAERFDPAVIIALEKHGYEIVPYDSPWSFSAGGLQLAGRRDGEFFGVADPRRDGAAMALNSD